MAAMDAPSRQTAKAPKKSRLQKIYSPLGFSTTYNFVLWFIFAGALLGFCLARFMYINFSNNFCPKGGSTSGNSAAPGECYYYINFDRYKIGIMLHLCGVLPAGVLAVFQFTPFIRHRWIIIHRIMGYAALLLYSVGLVGALMIARRAFGGGLDIQAWVGFVGIGILVCFIISYVNIKRLQIEQHRAWMLRGWFYAGSIITTRIIMIISTVIISTNGQYYTVWPCAKIETAVSDPSQLLQMYPTCEPYLNGTNLEEMAIVTANLNGASGAEVGAALSMSFGIAVWLATAIHAIGVEVYLHLTPREAQRLRQVSYQRQLEAGMRNPGSAGLTADRLGDTDKWESDEQVPRNSSSGSDRDVHRK